MRTCNKNEMAVAKNPKPAAAVAGGVASQDKLGGESARDSSILGPSSKALEEKTKSLAVSHRKDRAEQSGPPKGFSLEAYRRATNRALSAPAQ